MRMFFRLVSSEALKMSRLSTWLTVAFSPILSLLIGARISIPEGIDAPTLILGTMALLHGMLFLPIMAGLFSSSVCRYEHAAGGWKQLLVLPVSRTQVYFAKFTVVIGLLAISQLLFLAAIILTCTYHGLTEVLPWRMFLASSLNGWIACLPLVALQLAFSLKWISFAAPLAVNVSLTIPNMLIINSAKYGPYYPWAQPVLAMMPANEANYGAFTLPYESLVITMMGSFVIFLSAGLLYFQRKEI